MNKPIAAKPAPDFSRVSTPERFLADPAPQRKPTGPVIYQVEKGADVWPVRNTNGPNC